MPKARRGIHVVALAISVFAIALAAVPALAEDGTAGMPLPPPPPAGSGEDNASGGSTAGYVDASPGQAASLFTNNFSDTVDSLSSDPPDLSGEHPTFVNDHVAVVSPDAGASDTASRIASILERDGNDLEAARADLAALDRGTGTTKLLSSTLPIRTNSDGAQAPVDLSLEAQGNGYAPDNPLVDLTLPGDLSDEVAVGDQGIKIDFGGGESSNANQIGGDNLFYADAAPATDVVLAPISPGLETFYQLRASESPDHLRMEFTLPAGADLTETGGGGAAILRDGETLASIHPPSASDAAGNPVDVGMTVEGDSLVLDVPHSNPEIRYPISVDPVMDLYTWSANGGGRFADWTANQTTGSPYQLRTTCIQNVTCSSGTTGPTGLYSLVAPNQSVAAQSSGGWQYSVPHYPWTSAYISLLNVGPLTFNPRGDTATNPFMFAGVYADNSSSYLDSKSQNATASNLYWGLDPGTATGGKRAVFSLWSWASRTVSAWRSAYLGGASVWLGDTDLPELSDVTHSGISIGQADGSYSHWVDDVIPSVSVTAADNGLGVKSLMVPRADGSLRTVSENCNGTSASPCPQRPDPVTAAYDTSQMPNGPMLTGVVAIDALDNATARMFVIQVDHTAPQITLSDQLYDSAQQIDSEFSNLHVDATDGDGSSASTSQSGVEDVEIRVDGVVQDDWSQDCPQGSCPMHVDWELYAPNYTSGQHTVKVTATDQLGHERVRSFTVTIGQLQHWDPLPEAGEMVEVAGQDGNAIRCADGQKLMIQVPDDSPPVPDPSDPSLDDPEPAPSSSMDDPIAIGQAPPLVPRCPQSGQAADGPIWTPMAAEADPTTDYEQESQSPVPIPLEGKSRARIVWTGPVATNQGRCVRGYSEVSNGVYNKGYVGSTTQSEGLTYTNECYGMVYKHKHRIAVAWQVWVHNKNWKFCTDSGWSYNYKNVDWGKGIYWNFHHVPCGRGMHVNRAKSFVYYQQLGDHWKGGRTASPPIYWPGND
jgi:hypothetical protein